MATTDLSEAQRPSTPSSRKRRDAACAASSRSRSIPRVVLIARGRPVHRRRSTGCSSARSSRTGADAVPADPDPGQTGSGRTSSTRSTTSRFGLYALNSLIITVGDHDRGGPVEHPRRLRLLEDPVAGPQHAVLHLHRDALPAIPGDPGGAVRHLRQAAVVRPAGTRKSWVDTFLPLIVPGVLRQPVLHLPDAPVHAGHPARSCPTPPGSDGASEIQTVLEGHPAADQAGHRRRRDLRRGRRLERVPVASASILQDNSKYPLAVGLAFFTSEHDVAYNLLMAAATPGRPARSSSSSSSPSGSSSRASPSVGSRA